MIKVKPRLALGNVLCFLRFSSSSEFLFTVMNDTGSVEIVCFKFSFGKFSCPWLMVDFVPESQSIL